MRFVETRFDIALGPFLPECEALGHMSLVLIKAAELRNLSMASGSQLELADWVACSE